jgi:F-type H+-transporting ATPase subunit b
MATTPPAGTEAAHDAASVFPPFDSTFFPSQLLWLVISFGALYWLMSRIALPRVKSILTARQQKISTDLDAASADQAKANDAAAAYEQSLATARSNAQDLVRVAHETIAAETETKRQALEVELNRKLASIEAQIAETKRTAMANVAGIARDAAIAIVERLIGKPADPQAVERAVTSVRSQ